MKKKIIIITIIVIVLTIFTGPHIFGFFYKSFIMMWSGGISHKEQERIEAEVKQQFDDNRDVFIEVAEALGEMPEQFNCYINSKDNNLPEEYSSDKELMEKINFILEELDFEAIYLAPRESSQLRWVTFTKQTKFKFQALLVYYFNEEDYPDVDDEEITLEEGWYFSMQFLY